MCGVLTPTNGFIDGFHWGYKPAYMGEITPFVRPFIGVITTIYNLIPLIYRGPKNPVRPIYFRPFIGAKTARAATWRIIPVSKWLGSPPFISHKKAIWNGNNPLRGQKLTMVINHLQVLG